MFGGSNLSQGQNAVVKDIVFNNQNSKSDEKNKDLYPRHGPTTDHKNSSE